MIIDDQKELLPVGQMARHLRVPVRWLRAEAESGRVPHLRADKQLLFHVDTVERVLSERAQQVPEKSEK